MKEDVNRTIHLLEKKLQTATLENDAQAIDALKADDWVNVNPNGTVTTKPQLLAILAGFRFISIENKHVQIRTYPNLAIVTGESTRTLELAPGNVKVSHVIFSRTYTQIDGVWQLVFTQATPL